MRGLSEDRARGLAGELLYLRKCFNEGGQDPGCCHGWIGPEEGDRDLYLQSLGLKLENYQASSIGGSYCLS